ncbi:NADPH-dependent FMN reductase [Kibdelosporangium phytohabitans]|uniref:FMN reductase n=1 Tax=Kibdelosporangium phytohabitans TaxID=860235 RepID=A0A0N9I0F2_9PSEU|nr:NADPH-dependent FMN reductase [Kibdelosporangium phytohabitans]ALG09469.1 FMN reductase [Kibdelosporangium phytohabitans]MBE1469240.1 chromate reductase [Kibdelosporangium phytohabitans]
MTELTVLALSGSLRGRSHNTALLHAARKLNPGGLAIEIEQDLALLPLYDQDMDTESPPVAVTALRARIAAADALLIATPEHNASVPAALKNAIDWASTAPCGLLRGKPVAIAGASPGPFGSVRAQLALRQILAAVGAEVVVKPEVTVFHCDTRLTDDGVLTDSHSAGLLRDLLTALARKATVNC